MAPWEIQILYSGFAFIRGATFLLWVPFLGGSRLPTSLTMSIAVGLALLIGPSGAVLPQDLLSLFLLALKEGCIGFLMSFGVYLSYSMLEFAMQIVSNEMGFSMSNVLDPFSDKPHNPLESLWLYAFSLVLLISNTHHTLLIAFKHSFDYFPIHVLGSFLNVQVFLQSVGYVFLMGLQIGAPLVAANFLINMTFFILGKAAPKMNVFVISFAVRALAGFTVLLFLIRLFFQYLQKEALATPQRMLAPLLQG